MQGVRGISRAIAQALRCKLQLERPRDPAAHAAAAAAAAAAATAAFAAPQRTVVDEQHALAVPAVLAVNVTLQGGMARGHLLRLLCSLRILCCISF